MNKFEFVKYEATPQEKHMGVATVKLYGKILAKFKIINTKDGSNFFPAAPSLKIDDKYVSALIMDSSTEKEELDILIKQNVRMKLAGITPPQEEPKYEQTSFLDGCPF